MVSTERRYAKGASWDEDFATGVVTIQSAPPQPARTASKVYRWLWLTWALAFFAIEIPAALDKKPGATLTEHIKDVFALWPMDAHRAKGWWVRRLLFLAALSWVLGHFLLGGYFK